MATKNLAMGANNFTMVVSNSIVVDYIIVKQFVHQDINNDFLN